MYPLPSVDNMSDIKRVESQLNDAVDLVLAQDYKIQMADSRVKTALAFIESGHVSAAAQILQTTRVGLRPDNKKTPEADVPGFRGAGIGR